ncbi:prealbumin-like fold domain-containing protein [Lachnospiraceae bacterium OttesenSCG-928-D06]|nr:prealbumin-like fold domain-containing protein [Lachnospiraceae bacterium OttesenSCG-928-D06]
MGMPIITASDVERSQAITDLIASVALEQAALSHIMNAEGEKLQAVIANYEADDPTVTLEMLLEANASVTDLVSSVATLENHLQAKLALFSGVSRLSFYFRKHVTATSLPIAGAVFALYQENAIIATATSDENGIVLFTNIMPGGYMMEEITPPPGYHNPDLTPYSVVVNGPQDVKINGVLAEDFTVYNIINSGT